ncbi:hypothetical protein ACHAWF_002817 [Thalassiosira exigua]
MSLSRSEHRVGGTMMRAHPWWITLLLIVELAVIAWTSGVDANEIVWTSFAPDEERVISTTLEDASSKPVLMYAGAMFDVRAKENVEITAVGFNTFRKDPVNVWLYAREGSFRGAPQTDLAEWNHVATVSVVGRGFGTPTYVSFDPILVRRKRTAAFYVTSDGPNLRSSDAEAVGEGEPVAQNQDIVLFKGIGKRIPIDDPSTYHRAFNGALRYRVVAVPTPAPTTPSPTIGSWEDAAQPPNPPRDYFNYDPRSEYGPWEWTRVASDRYYERFRRLRLDVRRNRCANGKRQSPRDLCRTTAKCEEIHETRMRAGDYGLDHSGTRARPTPHIMSNKLRLAYKERWNDRERPLPPGADFSKNVFNSGVQDMLHTDVKVRSEHRLCGRQYDAEMQQYYLHADGSLEAVAILVEVADDEGGHNAHFQTMLDYFQVKFDGDRRLCERRRRRARALFGLRQNGGKETMPVDLDMTPASNETISVESSGEVGDQNDDTLDTLRQRIRGRSLAALLRRREQKVGGQVWDPAKPWAILKTIHFWAYEGSTTEPPCFEGIKWRVMDVPMTISPAQYVQLKRLMFDHVDPDTCRGTSAHFDESNARPVQPYRGGPTYRCRRVDYPSDQERWASGRRRGFVSRKDWKGVDMYPYVEPEFANV